MERISEQHLRAIFQHPRHWTSEEDAILLNHARVRGTRRWGELDSSGALPRRDNKSCCNRFLFLKKRFLEQRSVIHFQLASGASKVPTIVCSRQGVIPLGHLSFTECDELFLPRGSEASPSRDSEHRASSPLSQMLQATPGGSHDSKSGPGSMNADSNASGGFPRAGYDLTSKMDHASLAGRGSPHLDAKRAHRVAQLPAALASSPLSSRGKANTLANPERRQLQVKVEPGGGSPSPAIINPRASLRKGGSLPQRIMGGHVEAGAPSPASKGLLSKRSWPGGSADTGASMATPRSEVPSTGNQRSKMRSKRLGEMMLSHALGSDPRPPSPQASQLHPLTATANRQALNEVNVIDTAKAPPHCSQHIHADTLAPAPGSKTHSRPVNSASMGERHLPHLTSGDSGLPAAPSGHPGTFRPRHPGNDFIDLGIDELRQVVEEFSGRQDWTRDSQLHRLQQPLGNALAADDVAILGNWGRASNITAGYIKSPFHAQTQEDSASSLSATTLPALMSMVEGHVAHSVSAELADGSSLVYGKAPGGRVGEGVPFSRGGFLPPANEIGPSDKRLVEPAGLAYDTSAQGSAMSADGANRKGPDLGGLPPDATFEAETNAAWASFKHDYSLGLDAWGHMGDELAQPAGWVQPPVTTTGSPSLAELSEYLASQIEEWSTAAEAYVGRPCSS